MWPDLRYALRTLRNHPGFAAVTILTLALGIGANAVIFSIVEAVFLAPLPYPEPDRLVTLWQQDPQKGPGQVRVSPANFADWREQSHVFEHMGFYPAWGGSQTFRLVGADGAERVAGAYGSAGLFRALGVEPLLGRTFAPEEDEREANPAAILGYGLWQRRFGGARDVLGRTVTVDTYGFRTYTVVGVMPPGFDFPDRSEIWLPAGWMGVQMPPAGASARCCSWLVVVARLKPDSTLTQAQTEMDTIAGRILEHHPEARESPGIVVIPLLEQMVGPLRRSFVVLMGAVVFVLLIACANIAGLMLSRSVARQKEIVMRVVLGAGRGRLIRQFLIESLALALAGGGAGLLLAVFGLKLVVAAASDKIPRLSQAEVNLPVLAFTAAATILTGLLFGLTPAWHATRTALGARHWTGRAMPARKGLIIFEIALATMLLACATLLIESFLRLSRVNPGFRTENVLTARFDMTGRSFAGRTPPRVYFQRLMDRIRGLPGVVSVGGVSMLPLADAGPAGQSITIPERGILPAADSAKAKTGGATPDYFRTMGVPLLRGRFFTESDGTDAPPVAIINETMARRYWPGEDPIGRRAALGSRERLGRARPGSSEPDWMQIIGVAADMRGMGLDAEPRPELYLPYWQWPWYEVDLVVRATADPVSLAAGVRREAHDLDRNALITAIRTMDEVVGDSVAQPRFRAVLLGIFAGSALLLAALGIYGVVSYSTVQRTQEIGIRMALGAQPGNVLSMILAQALKLAAAGILIGLAGFLAVSRILATLLFGVSATEPAAFISVSLLLTTVAAVASFIPACRAARVDPMVALRHD